MSKLVAIVGASGVGKTSLAQALNRAGKFAVAYEQHAERPFQASFKQDKRYGLGNQIDYLLLRAEQEKELRSSPLTGLIDGGLDLDYHGYTRLFHARGLLNEAEFDLCRRFYELTRQLLPPPDLIVHITASEEIIRQRLAARQRINIASAEDTAQFNSFLDEWLAAIPAERLLELDVAFETIRYSKSLEAILERLSV